jgi:hypothetical protein
MNSGIGDRHTWEWEPRGHLHQLRERVSLHLSHHLTAVRLYRDLAYAEFPTDLFIQQAGGYQRHDLPFARRERHVTVQEVYGSNQVELAWTVIPILIVAALFMAAARVIADTEQRGQTANVIAVIAIAHQFWWEYRYPGVGVTTANELHVPLSDPADPTPTYITLLSADTDHSFWVPRLAGKTDLIPNHPNQMWIDPYETVAYAVV